MFMAKIGPGSSHALLYLLQCNPQNIYQAYCSLLETPKAEKCSDWTENLATDSSRYSKKLSIYPLIIYLTLLESNCVKCVFNFQTFLTVLFYKLFLKNGTLTSSFTSQEFITVGIFEIYFTTTDI
jgi:hypothetical protein